MTYRLQGTAATGEEQRFTVTPLVIEEVEGAILGRWLQGCGMRVHLHHNPQNVYVGGSN